MAYTFGTANGDDINFGVQSSWISTARSHLVMGWYRPTTLTAGRVYFGNNNTVGLRVGATTSELEFVTDQVTTDGVLTTSGAGITTDKWWFIAVMFCSFNTGPTVDAAFWVGDAETAPVQVSRTLTTSPVGNASNNVSVGIGNQGSVGNVAFQGDIAMWVHTSDSSIGSSGLFQQTANGTLDNECLTFVERRFILPWWARADMSLMHMPPGRAAEWNLALTTGGVESYIRSNGVGGVRLDVGIAPSATVAGASCPSPRTAPFFSSPYVRR